jgi:hypothetical protein
MFGPQVSLRDHRKLTPFLQVLERAAHAYDVTLDGCTAPIYACTPLPAQTAAPLKAMVPKQDGILPAQIRERTQ